MPIRDVLIPQMGEGLQEVRILAFSKRPGEHIAQDELIYSMETDKATMEVESPFEGKLVEWLAAEGQILPIGAPIARVETEATVAEAPHPQQAMAPPRAPVAPRQQSGGMKVPPRTRLYCKHLGLSDEEMAQIAAESGTLLPEDVDRYVAHKQEGQPATGPEYTDHALSQAQRLLIYHFKRSTGIVVPGTIKRPVAWNALKSGVQGLRERDFTFRPSEFQTFAYCVAQCVQAHPRFRSTLVGDELIREYPHLNLGIAVSRQNGDLVSAVVPAADTLPYDEFISNIQERIRAAREGGDQSSASTQMHLTYMGAHGVIDAVPVLVAPAVAVLFVGATYEQAGETYANLALTIDHRLINGVHAAEFLSAVVERVEAFSPDVL